MAYIDGFVIAAPIANKQQFIDHAEKFEALFVEMGATRVLACCGDDVKSGKWTDDRRAVNARDAETVVFSWVEWPDKASRDAAMSNMDVLMRTDPRWDPATNPMSFDGKRMIFGGFQPVVDVA